MKTLHISGRRWFDKVGGNTYHSSTVYVDGEFHAKIECTYGYGDHYIQSATQLLDKAGLLPGLGRFVHGGTESLWRYCERSGIRLVTEVSDVSRKKDL